MIAWWLAAIIALLVGILGMAVGWSTGRTVGIYEKRGLEYEVRAAKELIVNVPEHHLPVPLLLAHIQDVVRNLDEDEDPRRAIVERLLSEAGGNPAPMWYPATHVPEDLEA